MTFDSGNQGCRLPERTFFPDFNSSWTKIVRYVSHPEAEERMGKLAARVSSGQKKSTSSYLCATPHISTIFVHGTPIFEKKGSAGRRGPGWRQQTRSRPVLVERELGRDRLGYAQAIDGGAHDAARVTRAFAAWIDASGRLLVRIGQIACQSRLEVLPANHADGT